MNVKTRDIKISMAGKDGMLPEPSVWHNHSTNEGHKEISTGAQQRFKIEIL